MYAFTRMLSALIVAVAGIVLVIIGIVKISKANKALNQVERGDNPKGIYTIPLILSIAAVVVCLVAIIWNPVRDIYFYICIIIAGICSAVSYWTMFSIHNKGTLRKLPQLGKRGGDE